MAELDNYHLIRSLLSFKEHDTDTFYDVQVLTRGKDHPEMPSANHAIRSYYVTSFEQFDKIQNEIHKLCDLFGARCYINVAPKSLRKTALYQLKYLSERVYNEDVKAIWKTWSTSAGTVKPNEQRWVVDIDTKEESIIEDIINLINSLQPGGDKIIAKVPTLNGLHLITSPFNVADFKKEFPDVDIHKNNPTLLYVPSCLTEKKNGTTACTSAMVNTELIKLAENAYGIELGNIKTIGELINELANITGYNIEVSRDEENGKYQFFCVPDKKMGCRFTYMMTNSTPYNEEQECYENAIIFLIKHSQV